MLNSNKVLVQTELSQCSKTWATCGFRVVTFKHKLFYCIKIPELIGENSHLCPELFYYVDYLKKVLLLTV